MTTVALFGDVQGFASIYADALVELGVDVEAGVVPEGLVVVQVGDLIHKGPESDAAVSMANRLLRCSPDNYVQLTGNHEGQYLGGPVFWSDTISDEAARSVARWYVEGASRIAFGFQSVEAGPVLVTHGGMSSLCWTGLGEPTDPVAVAAALNEQFWNDPAVALRPGIMLWGEKGPPGVAWTEPNQELYGPWFSRGSMPFSQVHGHASPYSWAHGKWYPGSSRRVRRNIEVDEVKRHTRLELGSHVFLGIDTAFSEKDVAPIVPLLLTRA